MIVQHVQNFDSTKSMLLQSLRAGSPLRPGSVELRDHESRSPPLRSPKCPLSPETKSLNEEIDVEMVEQTDIVEQTQVDQIKMIEQIKMNDKLKINQIDQTKSVGQIKMVGQIKIDQAKFDQAKLDQAKIGQVMVDQSKIEQTQIECDSDSERSYEVIEEDSDRMDVRMDDVNREVEIPRRDVDVLRRDIEGRRDFEVRRELEDRREVNARFEFDERRIRAELARREIDSRLEMDSTREDSRLVESRCEFDARRDMYDSRREVESEYESRSEILAREIEARREILMESSQKEISDLVRRDVVGQTKIESSDIEMRSPHHYRQQREKSVDSVMVKEERPDSTEDIDDCVPLDLSVHGGASGRLSPGVRDSGTDSDDSGGRCSPENAKAYKKSLIKRYCKSKFLRVDDVW